MMEEEYKEGFHLTHTFPQVTERSKVSSPETKDTQEHDERHNHDLRRRYYREWSDSVENETTGGDDFKLWLLIHYERREPNLPLTLRKTTELG